jgi:hypothetical protein
MYVDYNDGRGWVQVLFRYLGVAGSSSADTYSLLSCTLQAIVNVSPFRVLVQATSWNSVYEGQYRNIQIENQLMSVFGAKR